MHGEPDQKLHVESPVKFRYEGGLAARMSGT